MKSQISKIAAVIMMAMLVTGKAKAQQVDPTLTATVVAQTEMLKEKYKKRENLLQELVASNALITANLKILHNVEDQTLKYLKEASHIVENLHQVKEAIMLAGVRIPDNATKLANAVPKNLKGTFIATMVSNKVTDAVERSVMLVPYVKQLVTSGTYDVKVGVDSLGKDIYEKNRVNLLNSAERYLILDKIVHELSSINFDLQILAYQVQYMGWRDMIRGLDPEGWIKLLSGKLIVKDIIREWNSL